MDMDMDIEKASEQVEEAFERTRNGDMDVPEGRALMLKVLSACITEAHDHLTGESGDTDREREQQEAMTRLVERTNDYGDEFYTTA